MGYGYAETFLIIFLTHPGVIIPTTSTLGAKAMSYLGDEMQGAIPDEFKGGAFPPPVSALWQMFWAWVLSLPGDRSAGFGWVMFVIYILFLLLYMKFAIPLRVQAGV